MKFKFYILILDCVENLIYCDYLNQCRPHRSTLAERCALKLFLICVESAAIMDKKYVHKEINLRFARQLWDSSELLKMAFLLYVIQPMRQSLQLCISAFKSKLEQIGTCIRVRYYNTVCGFACLWDKAMNLITQAHSDLIVLYFKECLGDGSMFGV